MIAKLESSATDAAVANFAFLVMVFPNKNSDRLIAGRAPFNLAPDPIV